MFCKSLFFSLVSFSSFCSATKVLSISEFIELVNELPCRALLMSRSSCNVYLCGHHDNGCSWQRNNRIIVTWRRFFKFSTSPERLWMLLFALAFPKNRNCFGKLLFMIFISTNVQIFLSDFNLVAEVFIFLFQAFDNVNHFTNSFFICVFQLFIFFICFC